MAPFARTEIAYAYVRSATAITGEFQLMDEGIALDSAATSQCEVDLTTLKSDSDNRDGQVQGRILQTDQFPKATFKLAQPIELDE